MDKNVAITVKGNKMIIEVDLSKEQGPSQSGKTIIIGTTAGAVEVAPGVKANINVYKTKK